MVCKPALIKKPKKTLKKLFLYRAQTKKRIIYLSPEKVDIGLLILDNMQVLLWNLA